MLKINKFFAALLFLMVFFIVFSIKSEPVYNFSDINKLIEEVERVEADNSRIKIINNDLKSRIDAYNKKVTIGLSEEQILKNDLKLYKTASCMSDVSGEGVIILLNDATQKLRANQDPNTLLIHDFDVKMVLFELRNSGAEAISINGERYIFNYTDVQCNGPTIKVGNKKFSQPFIIKAIGDRKRISEALNDVTSHIYRLKQNGLFVEINTSVHVVIKGHKKDLVYKFIEEE